MSFLDTIKTAVTSQAAEKAFLLGKNSPKILFAAGTVGVIGTVVLACRATLQLPPILEDLEKFNMSALEHLGENPEIEDIAEYTKDLRKYQAKTAVKILKLYAIPVGLGALSIGALTGSHIVLNKQNAGLLATVKVLEKGYNQYRERVREDLGEEKDREYANGVRIEKVEETLSDGTIKVTEKRIVGYDEDGLSPYAAFWGAETSKFFSRIPHENPQILATKQMWANDRLNAKGFLFLNEAREILGMEPVPEGQRVGWLSTAHPAHKDGAVTFGIHDTDHENYQQFLDGRILDVTLDFNVDGEIWDLIGKKNPKLYNK